jgi:hypothetical protein
VRFKEPGRATLYARFALDAGELEAMKRALATARAIDRSYTVELTDADGVVHATVEKVIYIRRNLMPPAVISARGMEPATAVPQCDRRSMCAERGEKETQDARSRDRERCALADRAGEQGQAEGRAW